MGRMITERVTDPDSGVIEEAFAFTRSTSHPGEVSCMPNFYPSRGQFRRWVKSPVHRMYVVRDDLAVVCVMVMHEDHVAQIYADMDETTEPSVVCYEAFAAAHADHPRVFMSLPESGVERHLRYAEERRERLGVTGGVCAVENGYEWRPD